MNDVNRRRLLKTTGAGAGIALGTRTALGEETVTPVDGSTNQTGQTRLSTFTAAVSEVSLGIDVSDPDPDTNTNINVINASSNISISGDYFFSFQGEILDNGRWRPIDGSGNPTVLKADILKMAIDLIFEVLPMLEIAKTIKSVGQGYLSAWQEVNQTADGKVFEVTLGDVFSVLNTETDLSIPTDPVYPADDQERAPTTALVALLFDAITAIDSLNDNYQGSGTAVDTVTLVDSQGNDAISHFDLIDIGALIAPILATLDLNSTQADALFALLNPLLPDTDLSSLPIDTKFLTDPTAENVGTVLGAVGGFLPTDYQYSNYQELSQVINNLLLGALGGSGFIDWNVRDTLLTELAQIVFSIDNLILDQIPAGTTLNIISEPSNGAWDPRTSDNLPKVTHTPSLIRIPISFQGVTFPELGIHLIQPDTQMTTEESGTNGLTGSFAFFDNPPTDGNNDAAAVEMVNNEFTFNFDEIDLVEAFKGYWDTAEFAEPIDDLVWRLFGTSVGTASYPTDAFIGSSVFDCTVPVTNNGETDENIRTTLEVQDSGESAIASYSSEQVVPAGSTVDFVFTVDPTNDYDTNNFDSINTTAEFTDSSGDIYPTGEPENLLNDLDPESIVEAVNPNTYLEDATAGITDSPGRHVLEFDIDFTGLDTKVIDQNERQNLASNLPDKLPNGIDVPQDIDNDGLFEDTSGTGVMDIFDVQTFYLDYNSTAASNYPAAYNFSGQDATNVGIFDVQGLFNKVTNQ